MKPLLALIVAVGAFLAWQKYHDAPAAVEVAQAPAPPLHHLAPEGTFFLREYVSVPTKHGVTGWTPGQRVYLDAAAAPVAGKTVVTDGAASAALDSLLLTDDADEARALLAGDQQSQAAERAQVNQARTERQQQLLAAQIESANNVQAASLQTAADSSMSVAPGRLQASASYGGSINGGTVYYPVVVSGGSSARPPAVATQAVPAAATSNLSRPGAANVMSANATTRRPALGQPAMSSLPTRPGMNSAPSVGYGSVGQ